MFAMRLVLTCTAAVVAASVAAVGPAAVQEGAGRLGEPVVITGSALAPLLGAAREELSLWIWRGEGWERAPLQMDERDAAGAYLLGEDGTLDEDDELVFLADGLGMAAPPGSWPPDVGRSHAGLEVQVTDPLAAGAPTHGYLFRAGHGPPDSELWPSQVTYDPVSAEIRSANYILGLARAAPDGFVGIKRLSLFADPTDLVDRAKVRTRLRVLNQTVDITEENVTWQITFDPEVRAAGPLRQVVEAGGGRGVAYAHRIVTDLPRGVELPPSLDFLTYVRVSLDFGPEAVPATYRDGNVPDGVAVDGQPDPVRVAPMPAWREFVLAPGRLVLLGRGPDGSSVYYKDDGRVDARDTGDGMSYADSGVEVRDLRHLVREGFDLQMVVLPHRSSVTAERLAEEAANPLQVRVAGWAVPPSPTPTATDVPVTPTVSPVLPTATPTTAATPEVPNRPAYLPHLTG